VLAGESGDAKEPIGTLVDTGDSGDAEEPKDPGGLWTLRSLWGPCWTRETLGTLRSLRTLVDTGDTGDAKEPGDSGGPKEPRDPGEHGGLWGR